MNIVLIFHICEDLTGGGSGVLAKILFTEEISWPLRLFTQTCSECTMLV